MTIIAGFSSSRQGPAPLNLAAQLAATTGEKVIAAVIVERSLPPGADRLEDEYQAYVTSRATKTLDDMVAQIRTDADISAVVHDSASIPRGLMELVDQYDADLVVVGSSSSGLLGRVALGSVTEWLVHQAAVPVAIAPRGYLSPSGPVRRLTAAYGGAADSVGLIQSGADLARQWSIPMRIASFTVRPTTTYGAGIERSAEDLVVRQWTRRTMDAALKQLDEARAKIAVPDVDVVVGAGVDWGGAVDKVPWKAGDLLLLGSGAAGPMAQVFLGSAASKILRHAPVPVMILPRKRT